MAPGSGGKESVGVWPKEKMEWQHMTITKKILTSHCCFFINRLRAFVRINPMGNGKEGGFIALGRFSGRGAHPCQAALAVPGMVAP